MAASRITAGAASPRQALQVPPSKEALVAAKPSHEAVPTEMLPGDLTVTEHALDVPLDHADPVAGKIQLFVREVRAASTRDQELPYLLYLQGGPGHPAGRLSVPASGWLPLALRKYRVLLLDQRGTGRSSPVTIESLAALGTPEKQAALLAHFRADSIVRDCEIVRQRIAVGRKLTLLGQSFGGFCILTYLSLAPHGVERALFTFGLAPVLRTAEEVYRHTFQRMEYRNLRFYSRYPADIETVRQIVALLHASPAPLPRGGTLTPRRFLMLGLMLGQASGLETLHNLLEQARPASGPVRTLSQNWLLAVEAAQQGFETNPLYYLLHEPIYCDGPGVSSRWAAERVQASLGPAWDYTTRLEAGAEPVLLTGEMVFSWMADDYAWLRPLKGAANLLAAKEDWGHVYNRSALASGTSPVAALVAYDDVYVERTFSEETAELLGGFPRVRLWVSNYFQHSGISDHPDAFLKLDEMGRWDEPQLV